jgi:hypothetical protein
VLIDTAASRWPREVGVETSVTLLAEAEEGHSRWASTSEFAVCTRLSGAVGSVLTVCAALNADFFVPQRPRT